MEYKGFTINIQLDNDPQDPREWDNLGTMVCFHKRYSLGDKHRYSSPENFMIDLWNKEATQKEKRDFILEACKGDMQAFRTTLRYSYSNSIDDLFDNVTENTKIPDFFPESVLALPLYIYEHSGITMNTGGFHCPWDSGQVGWIYITNDKVKSEGHENTPVEKIYEYLSNEVKTYDKFLTGDIHGYTIEDANGEYIDSCWGFFSEEDALSEAKSYVDYEVKEKEEIISEVEFENHFGLAL